MTVSKPGSAPPVVAVFGAGAVGCYYGAKLAEAGVSVTLIGRAAHVEAVTAAGLRFDSGGVTRHIPMRATSDVGAGVAGASLVLFCVKTRDTEASARELAPLLAPGCVVVSLQNGVDNAAVMRSAAGIDGLAAVVYVAASMAGPGHLLHAGRGELVLGEYGPALPGRPREPGRDRRIASLFESAGVACAVSPDVRVELWQKLVINCAFNAVSALTRQRYGRVIAEPLIREMMRQIIDECLAVARAEGVTLPEAARQVETVEGIGAAMSAATSSMAQDMARGRKTEIDSLNGHVARRGAALGVPTPVNQALHALVRLAEIDLA